MESTGSNQGSPENGAPSDAASPEPGSNPGPSQSPAPGASPKPAPKPRAGGWLIEIAKTLALTLGIFFVIQLFIAQPFKVEQVSMLRTLQPSQYVLIDKLTPRFDDYKRGDIIVFNPPMGWTNEAGAPLIKRIIGVGGDRIELKDGQVLVNGSVITEPYVYDGQRTTVTGEESSWTLASNELFVMGDHRSNSGDSRYFGPITHDSVIGRAFLRYWPIDTFGILPTPTYAK